MHQSASTISETPTMVLQRAGGGCYEPSPHKLQLIPKPQDIQEKVRKGILQVPTSIPQFSLWICSSRHHVYLNVLLFVSLFKGFVKEHSKAPSCISRTNHSRHSLPFSYKSLCSLGLLFVRRSAPTSHLGLKVWSAKIRPELKAEGSVSVCSLQTPSTVNL